MYEVHLLLRTGALVWRHVTDRQLRLAVFIRICTLLHREEL